MVLSKFGLIAAAPIVEKTEELIEAAKEKVNEHMPAAKETLENVVETVKEKVYLKGIDS